MIPSVKPSRWFDRCGSFVPSFPVFFRRPLGAHAFGVRRIFCESHATSVGRTVGHNGGFARTRTGDSLMSSCEATHSDRRRPWRVRLLPWSSGGLLPPTDRGTWGRGRTQHTVNDLNCTQGTASRLYAGGAEHAHIRFGGPSTHAKRLARAYSLYSRRFMIHGTRLRTVTSQHWGTIRQQHYE